MEAMKAVQQQEGRGVTLATVPEEGKEKVALAGKERMEVLTAVLEEEGKEVILATALEAGKEGEEVEEVQMKAVTAVTAVTAVAVAEIEATKDLAFSKEKNITITENISVDIGKIWQLKWSQYNISAPAVDGSAVVDCPYLITSCFISVISEQPDYSFFWITIQCG